MRPPFEAVLTRECEAIQIPSGMPIRLPENAEVTITQTLGGTFTVAYPGGLARIDAKDRDALGLDAEAEADGKIKPVDGDLEKQVWTQLKMVYDPEIPVNIVDLGLVYSLELNEAADGGKRADVKMTLTAPGCGMGPTIANDAKMKCLAVEGISEAEVELVWDPPWNQDMISEVGRMKLGMV